MLESVHGLGKLLKSGWKPKRSIVIGSWDAEEEGLIGSTEWGEQHQSELANAAAYFNMDVAVSGPKFGAASVPSLKHFLRDVTKVVPSPKGGTVYADWRKDKPVRAGEPAGDQHQYLPSARSAGEGGCAGAAIWAAVPTTPFSCNTWECRRPTLALPETMACITRPSTTSTGSRNSAIPTSPTSSRWRESLEPRSSAWPAPTCCRTTTKNTGRKSQPISIPRGRKR